jgi:hypothetical protein
MTTRSIAYDRTLFAGMEYFSGVENEQADHARRARDHDHHDGRVRDYRRTPLGAVFYGLVVGGGTVQWWQRRDIDTFGWTFLVLAVGIASMRWDANVAVW